ncbi:MAG: NAD(P)-dependent alcohol dehydrogenase [Alcaligenaceae bacterium]|nr:NAD(P)-dependent alcohol dehydrogenase [Alcaligenaceae bacterium]
MGIKTIYIPAGGGFERLEIGASDAREPTKGEITVRLYASSLNYHDLLVVSGATPPTERRIPMSDGAGEVIAVGEGVEEFVVGDRVVSTFFPDWLDGETHSTDFSRVPGDGIDGYARQQVTRPATAFTHAPVGWTHAEAATLTTAGLTAWRALFVNGNLRAGQTVLVQGTGGVSIFALQMAKAAGARVIATSSSNDKLTKISALGADEVINYREDRHWGQTARRMTNGRGVDHVIEVGGPDTLEQSIHASRVGAHIAIIGVLSGLSAQLPIAQALAYQVRLQAILVGSRRMQQDFVRAVEAIPLRPVIDQHFPLEEIVEAFKYQASGQHFGKIVLDI